jgi:hypothetical protein
MTGSVNGVNGAGSINVSDIGSGSVQLLFAKLQLTLAEQSKSNAMNYINDIQATQEEQKQVAAWLQIARQGEADTKAGQGNTPGTSGGCSTMPDDMHAYFVANGLAMGSTDDKANNKDEWGINIASLQAKLDSLGTDTQQKMVFVQDFMGQYNSSLQGANSVIQQRNQTLGELARSR